MPRLRKLFSKGGSKLTYYQNNTPIVSGLGTLSNYIALAGSPNYSDNLPPIQLYAKPSEEVELNQNLTPTVTFDFSQPPEVIKESTPVEKNVEKPTISRPTKKAKSSGGSTGEKFVKDIYNSYYRAVRPRAASDADARLQAAYLTQKAAYETGYGKSVANTNNYGGHRTAKGWLSFKSMDDFTKRDVQLLDKKWGNWRKARNHREFVNSITTNNGYGVYVPRHEYNGYFGLTNRVNSYINKKLKYGGISRPKAWIGALIGAAASIGTSLLNANSQKKQLEEQRKLEHEKLVRDSAVAQSQQMLLTQNAQRAYEDQFRMPFRRGGRIRTTDGGTDYYIGNGLHQVVGRDHETGGVGYNVNGEEIELENGEVWDTKNGAMRVFSDTIGIDGQSFADLAKAGYDKNKLFKIQQRMNGDSNGIYASLGTKIKDVFMNPGGLIPVLGRLSGYLNTDEYNTTVKNYRDTASSIIPFMRLGGRKKFLIGGDNDGNKGYYRDKNGNIVYTSFGPMFGAFWRNFTTTHANKDELVKQYYENKAKKEADNSRKVVRHNTKVAPARNTETFGVEPFVPGTNYSSNTTTRRASNGKVNAKPVKITSTAPSTPAQTTSTAQRTTPTVATKSSTTGRTTGRTVRRNSAPIRRNNLVTGRLTPYSNYTPLTDDSFYTPEYNRFWNWMSNNRESQEANDWLGRINGGEFGDIGPNFFSMDDVLRLAHDYKRGPVHNAFGKASERYSSDNLPAFMTFGDNFYPHDFTEVPVRNTWGEFATYGPRTPKSIPNDGMGVVDTRGVTTVSKDDLANLQANIDASTKPSIGRRNNLGMDLTTGDWIGLGANILGGGLSWLINRNALRNLRDPERPIPIQAGKLVTNFDITPQLAVNERARQASLNDIIRNTSSSVAGLDRRNLTNLNYVTNAGALWADKFNREVQMLNEDTKNQQTVAMQNAAIYNDYLTRLNETRNQNRQLRAENDVALVQGLGDAVNRFIAQGQQRYEDNNALRAYILSSHNGTAEKLSIGGVDLGRRNDEAAKAVADYDVRFYSKDKNSPEYKAALERQRYWNTYMNARNRRYKRYRLFS